MNISIKRHHERRDEKGYALLSIIVLSSFAMIFLLALSTVFISISRAEAVQNQKNLLIQAMDSGLDYSLQFLNNHPNSISATPQEFDLPAENLPALSPPLTVRVRLSQLKNYGGSVDWNVVKDFSALNTLVETIPPSAAHVYSLENRKNSWVLCEMTASRGVFSKSARAILEPQLIPPAGIDFAGAGVTAPNTPLFPQAVFANSLLNISRSTEFKALESTSNPVLQTNQSTTIDAGITIRADIVSNSVMGNEDNLPSVLGQITSSEIPQFVNTSQAPITGVTSLETLAPSPTASVGNQIEFPPSANVDLLSSSYSTSSLNLDGNNTVNLPLTPNSPTKIFVDSNSSNLVIDTKSLNNFSSNPGDFQVFYNGTSNLEIRITDKSFSGLIYAPKANVTISGGDFNGAVVGDVVNINNNKMNLQTNVSSTTGSAGSKNIDYGLVFGKNGPDVSYFGYQPVTWQEVSNKLVE